MPYDTEAEASFRQQIIKELRRIEEKQDAAAARLDHSRTPWQMRMGDVTAILAVLGLVWTASQAFTRVDGLEEKYRLLSTKVEPVSELGWKVDGLRSDVTSLRDEQKQMGKDVTEMKQGLIRMGVNVVGKEEKR